MDILEFDNLFGSSTNTPSKPPAQLQRRTHGDNRLDFFSHLLKRLHLGTTYGKEELRQAPTMYANHVEYIQTFLPMIIEDTVSAIPETQKGGHLIECTSLTRWSSPFYIALCSCDKDSKFHGNELIHIQDENGFRIWGITKRAVRFEVMGESTLELFLYAEVPDQLPRKGRWLCMTTMDTNSHLREYMAVQSIPFCPLIDDILATSYAKKSKKKKKTDVEEFEDVSDEVMDKDLNPSQVASINTAVNRTNGITLIQGPPGTGKTRTVVSIINVLLKKSGESILVCTPSNTAVDEITCQLSKMKCKRQPRIVRVSAYGRGTSCKEVLLQTIAGPSESTKECLKQMEMESIESGAQDAAAQGWHSYEMDEILDRRDALEAACRRTEWSARKDVVREADIVLCTLSMAASPSMQSALSGFNTVVIDEAAQAVEPSTLISLTYGCKRCLLIGDPCQLPATVLSTEALTHGYGRSMFERLKEAGYDKKRACVVS